MNNINKGIELRCVVVTNLFSLSALSIAVRRGEPCAFFVTNFIRDMLFIKCWHIGCISCLRRVMWERLKYVSRRNQHRSFVACFISKEIMLMSVKFKRICCCIMLKLFIIFQTRCLYIYYIITRDLYCLYEYLCNGPVTQGCYGNLMPINI